MRAEQWRLPTEPAFTAAAGLRRDGCPAHRRSIVRPFDVGSRTRGMTPVCVRLDTIAPPHHDRVMRLTVNLDPDLYAVAVSFAKAEDCSISVAVNRLLRRGLPDGHRRPAARTRRRNGILVSLGRAPITADTVRRMEDEDDAS